MDIKELLLQLMQTPGVAFKNDIFKVISNAVQDFAEVYVNDNYLAADFGDKSKPAVLLEAHTDRICAVVTEVFNDGFLKVAPVGSVDGRFLPASSVTVYGHNGVKIFGVFTSVPPHIKKDNVTPSFDVCYVDTGVKNIENSVFVGDYVFFTPSATLVNNRVFGTALDNSAGVAAVISAGKAIYEAGSAEHIKMLFPLGEELGLRGAVVGAFAATAEYALCVDVSFGSQPGVSPQESKKLNTGAMIGISPVLNKKIYSSLKDTAISENISHTFEIMSGKTGTDADAISISKSGIPTGLISIPIRNMHTPVEVADIRDIEAVAKLIERYVLKGGFKC